MERRLAAILAADMVGYSRLVERDEDGTLARQKAYRHEIIDPGIASHRGRIVKTTGDGMLAEFASARDAVRCSIELQSALARREDVRDEDERIRYRIGINLGDVVFDEDDVFGDGVNVAARLEGLAEPGGVCISDPVLQSVGEGMQDAFRDMGSQRVKNISRPIRVWQWSPQDHAPRPSQKLTQNQTVRFCTSSDGTHIAYARVGTGPKVLKAPHWLGHIEYEWSNPIWRPFYETFCSRFDLVRFDQRGTGLSDWDTDRISTEAMREDMEAVVDASGLDRFAIFAASQGGAFAIDYALAHPERVSCIVFLGSYLRGRNRRDDAEETALYETALTMIRQGWGSPNALFRQFFISSFVPSASAELQGAFDELQRISSSSENTQRIFRMNAGVDLTDRAGRLRVPVLVMHARDDRVSPIDESRRLARAIPGARFVELPGDNHVVLEGTPAFELFFEEASSFIAAQA